MRTPDQLKRKHGKSRAIPLNKIPGYTQALHRARGEEFKTREDNWIALPQVIAGLPVRVMTVRDYVALLRVECPFLFRCEPDFVELGKFLWLLSPQLERWHNHAGWRQPWLVGCRWRLFNLEAWQRFLFARRLRRKLRITEIENAARAFNRDHPGKIYELPETAPLSRAIVDAFAYVDRIFIDRPAGIAKDGVGSGLHYLASWFDAMQSEYHMTDADVYRMPLPQLFARLKAIQLRRNPGEPEFNARQDALAAQIQRANPEDLRNGNFKFN